MNRFLEKIFISFPILLFLFDIIFLASGGWASNLGIPFRKVLFIYIFAFLVVIYLKKSYIKIDHVIYFITIVIFLVVWGFVVPYFNDVKASHALMDGQLFFGLLIIPFVGFFFVGYLRNFGYMEIIFRMLLLLALLHIALYAVALWDMDSFLKLVEFIKSILEPGVDDENTSIYMGVVDGKVRVFWGGSIFLLMFFYMSFLRFRESGKISFILIAIFAIYCTSTRAMLIALVIYFVYYLILKFLAGRYVDSFKIFFFALFLVLQTVPILIMADPQLLSVIGLGRDISDDLRYVQVDVLRTMLIENPVMGNGLGTSASIIRSESAPWSYELSIFALYMKIGLIGVAVLLFAFLILFSNGIKLSEEKKWRYAALGALVLSYNFCSNTNPFIFSFAGVVFISFFYVEYLKISVKK